MSRLRAFSGDVALPCHRRGRHHPVAGRLREPFERELLAVPRAEDNSVAVVLANRVDSPLSRRQRGHSADRLSVWDINVAAPRVLKLGAVMPKHIDLAVCRQKQMIPKVDMFANRLVETYVPIIAA